MGAAVGLARRIARCIKIMHKKGFIHDGLRPGNILLDSDEEELIFPVISEFRNVNIIDSAKNISGMDLVSCEGISLLFAAPELLKAFKNKLPSCTTFKCDVYSFSYVSLSWFTKTCI
jgi:serine/threonine protein kinase